MRTWILLLALLVLPGCSTDAVSEDSRTAADGRSSQTQGKKAMEPRQSKQSRQSCDLDARTLLPRLEAAMSPDATARMTMEMSGPGGPVFAFDAVFAYTRSGPEMELSSSLPGDPFALVYVDDRFFVSTTGKTGPYTEVDASNPIAEQLRGQMGSLDIASSFDAWRAGLVAVEAQGKETIDGKPTCHYTIRVDTAEAMAATGTTLPAGVPDTLAYQLFLTPDDLMRRIRFDVGGFTSEVDATRWNEPVDIEVPPTR